MSTSRSRFVARARPLRADHWPGAPDMRLPLLTPRTAADQRHLTDDQCRFALGTRSIADLIAPAAVEVARDHTRLEYLKVPRTRAKSATACHKPPESELQSHQVPNEE